ncbi:MAG: FAD-dependent oxidoreductase [Kiritimatiellae bacterium]|nr:FAD-dependent oxidoreductase [Kiritimatiellia bacterium]
MRCAICFLLLVSALRIGAVTVMVEAESFADKGGWVVDQQFMDQMGSPFLLAHGLGSPVTAAKTTVRIAEAGRYRVLARTRNWAAHWSKNGAPGRFSVAVNDTVLPKIMGVNGVAWAWHEAGQVELSVGEVSLELRDLTGFDGRCDAVALTTDATDPPNTPDELERYRRNCGLLRRAADDVKADLIVAGGGIAGICAAISASRLGLSVALLQDRPVLGGCNSSEVRVHLGGRLNIGPYPRLGDVVNEIGPAKGGNAQPAARYEDDRKMAVVSAEKNLLLFLSTRAIGVEKSGHRITAVIGRNIETGVETRFIAPLVVDCTGDGAVGMLAGAEYRYGRESQSETGEKTAVEKSDAATMGASVQWYSRKGNQPEPFPDIDWALPFTEQSCEKVKMGEWTWETGMTLDQINDFEKIRDYGLMVVYSNWNFLKNRSEFKSEYANLSLDWVAYVAGKRESRRLIGDYVLREQDLVDRQVYPDGTCCTTWSVDLHYPDPKNTKNFPGAEFKSIAKHRTIYPYPIPYRCLYSKNIGNLFMAGRNISVTHVALGTVRVMRTTGMMGEVVGMAAAVCKRNGCLPRDVYADHFDELKKLMEQGVGNGDKQPPQNYNLGSTLWKPEK